MSSLLIVKPIPAATITTSRGTGAANLLTPDPQEVWLDQETGTSATITIDFGAVISFDTIYLGGMNASDLARWSATCAQDQSAGVPLFFETFLAAPTMLTGDERKAFYFNAVRTARRITLTVMQPAGAPTLQVGVVMVGLSFQPTYGREYGSGRGLIDTGAKTRLASGGFGLSEGAIGVSYGFTMGDLTDDERRRLFAIVKSLGENRSLLMVEDPDLAPDLSEALHWTTFDRLEPYERLAPGATKWAFKTLDW